MHYILQIVFLALTSIAVWLFTKNITRIRKNIFLGKPEVFKGDSALRWKNVLLLALGQRKMFTKPFVAIMHFIIYAGFIIINIEVLEIILDGLLGTHRLFLDMLGGLYTFAINFFEILAFGVLAVCIVFLARRNLIKLKRFMSKDLNGWPRTDANYILIAEIVLMSLFLTMNAADRALQLQNAAHYTDTGNFIISGFIAPLFQKIGRASCRERVCSTV